MRFRHIAAAAALLSMSVPSLAAAQDPIDAFDNQSKQTYTKFMNTMMVLMTAAETMQEARGLKDTTQARQKLLEDAKKNMTKPDSKTIEAVISQAQADSKKMESMAEETTALTAEQKALFKKGILEYLVGVKETAVLAIEVPKLAQAATETAAGLMSNPMKFRKIKDAVGAAKEMAGGIPAVAKGHAASISALKKYVAKQGLDVQFSM